MLCSTTVTKVRGVMLKLPQGSALPGKGQLWQTWQTIFEHDMSVILVTGSYDHEIRFWEAWSGICSRTIARQGESGVSRSSFRLVFLLSAVSATYISCSKSIDCRYHQSKSPFNS
jgi:hypothetical protein